MDNELYAFKKMYLKDRDIKNLICIGESILYLARDEVAGKRVDRISAADFQKFYEKLIQMPVDQIEDRFGVNQEYAHLLIPAAIIYKQILEMTGAEMLWVPGIRMCDGIAADYAEKQKYLKFTSLTMIFYPHPEIWPSVTAATPVTARRSKIMLFRSSMP